MCVGDFNQLAPIAQSEAQNVLHNDIFSYLKIVDSKGDFHNHQWLVMLDEQRRMLPEISAFPSKYIYSSLLRDHSSVLEKKTLAEKEPFSNESMILVDLAGTYCAADKNLDNSRYNVVSAIISFAMAIQADTWTSKEEVGVITPYAAQARLIGAMIIDELGPDAGRISSATVHQFQGSERDTIIFDAVESYPGTQAGYLMSKNENRSLVRLINVAMTRAREKFIVQANSQFWLRALKEKKNFFVKLLDYMMNNSYVVQHAETRRLEKMLSDFYFGKNIKYYSKYEVAVKKLQEDIANAKTNIIVSLPSSEITKEFSNDVYSVLTHAKRNGVSVYVKAMEFEKLPDEWKKISQFSENAVFPLIVIDDLIVWYGLPDAKGKFKGKNNEYFTTVVPLYFRLKGKHTVDMIRSLTDIEMKLVDNIRKPLTAENVTERTQRSDAVKGESGIHDYVSKYVKCSICKQPMLVSRSYKGKVYLKCSTGDREHNAFLTKDIVNAYIMHSRPKCPQCKAQIIKCGVSKFGLWVMCENGHYPKPDEI